MLATGFLVSCHSLTANPTTSRYLAPPTCDHPIVLYYFFPLNLIHLFAQDIQFMGDLSKRSSVRVFLYIFNVTEETMGLVIHRDCVKPLYC